MAGWTSDPRRRAVIVLVATLVGLGVTARLGVWQLDRAGQKERLQASLDTRGKLPALGMGTVPADEAGAIAQHYRPVVLRGEWKAGASVFLDNRQMNGRPGFFVLTPLLLRGVGESAFRHAHLAVRLDDEQATQPPAGFDPRAQLGPLPSVR